MDAQTRAVLECAVSAAREIFGDNLVGVYLHGSLVLGGYNPARSDVDILIVVRHALAQAEKERWIRAVQGVDALCPGGGVEMSVVLERHCRSFVHPMPYELHFSAAHRQRALDNLPGYCAQMRGTDADLAAHCTVLRAAGIALCGAPIAEVFGAVPRADYLDSIRHDLAGAETEMGENPVYVVLNLCRTLAFVREGIVCSKQAGGLWARERVPADFVPLIDAALASYTAPTPQPFCFSPEQRRSFVAYMKEQLKASAEMPR